ncbi:MAG TPA: hypothetical protein VN877_05155 [Opitutaceae bacterium]|nr:hypothetical protein [Opitutaceae bacterium]
MKPILKVAIVAGGYVLAFLMAAAAVVLHTALAGESGAQASGGMSAFGDLVLFVAVFGAVALVPTGAGFYILFSRKRKLNQQSPEPTVPSGRGSS